ncbi:Phospholipid scramblase 3 (PL scramblase 3) (Ca(2+)-dependent phospholipid scramblase 3), partial [Durusdinium trenchii]
MTDENLAMSVVQMKQDARDEGRTLNYPGLAILKELDGLFVKQEWEVLEQVSSFWESQNHYTIFDPDGAVRLFESKESTNCCCRLFMGEHRPFSFKVKDATTKKGKKTAMVFKRNFRCCGFAPLGCHHTVDVHYMVDKDGNEIGRPSSRTLVSTVQTPPCHGGCCWPTYRIKDRYGRTQSKIVGPFCCVSDTCGAGFSVTDNEGKKTGHIRKLAPDSMKRMAMEIATEADTFQVKFDKELDPTIKIAIIAAVHGIDFAFFEDERGVCEGRCCDFYLCGYSQSCCPACCVCCCCDPKGRQKKNKERNRGAP